MKIKTLMDFLNKESDDEKEAAARHFEAGGQHEENVVYIENARLETAGEQHHKNALLASSTQWADRAMGEILIEREKLRFEDVDRVIDYQREKGLYFGEAAVELKLVSQDDILHALSTQFGYSYNPNEETLSQETVMAYSPFGEQAEEFRSLRSQLLSGWLTPDRKILAVVSPDNQEGRSYVASNLALAFSQSGHSTLLIDADMRAPRQHEIFNFRRRLGLSMLLAGRVKVEDLDMLPDQVSSFGNLSVLACGALPPNPAELLSRGPFLRILRELEKFYDVIIIDTPPAKYKADLVSIATVAGSALLVTRAGRSRMDATKHLVSILADVKARVVGAVLNQF